MVFCRLFLCLFCLLTSGLSASAFAASDNLILRGLVFPTIQVSLAGSIDNGKGDLNYKVDSNMENDNFKVYQEGQSLSKNSNKYRQLVVEAN